MDINTFTERLSREIASRGRVVSEG